MCIWREWLYIEREYQIATESKFARCKAKMQLCLTQVDGNFSCKKMILACLDFILLFMRALIGDMDRETPNIKKWTVFYPVYINSKKTVAEGRRISLSNACENPTCLEINDCCSHLKLPCAIELDKAYPRDFMQRGRVRVLLKKEDGTLCNPAITSRKQLMLRVAELVPRHPGRVKKQEPVATSTAGPSKSSKGGKKKR